MLVVTLSPKSQSRLLMFPVDVSENVTVNGSIPFVGLPLKFAVGGFVAIVRLIPRENETPVAVLLKLIASVYVPGFKRLAAELSDTVMLVLRLAPRVRFVAGGETASQ